MIGINASYRPMDEICIPERMDKDLLKYDVEDQVKGEIEFEIIQKSKTEVKVGIRSFSCTPNKRV